MNAGSERGVVRLRDVTDDDLPILFEYQREPEANRMAAFPPRDWDAFQAHWRKVLADKSNLAKIIELDGNVVGNIGAWGEPTSREVGYWIGQKYWGRGVATRALSALLSHVPERPLYAHVVKHNVASLRVLQKCGFTIVSESTSPASTGGDEVEELLLALEA
jgi:RimJ/RimL family protein N-acetyltransferase